MQDIPGYETKLPDKALASAAVGQVNGDSANHNPLALDAETMRAIGHQTVDMLVDMLSDAQAPALIRASPQEMARRVDAAAPEQPRPFPSCWNSSATTCCRS